MAGSAFQFLPPEGAASAPAFEKRVESRNEECLMCKGSVVNTQRPVTSFACGHACHASCAARYIAGGPGRECPDSACAADDPDAMRVAYGKEVVAAAIARGDIVPDRSKPADLSAGIRAALSEGGISFMSSSMSRFAAARDADVSARELRKQQYEHRWCSHGMAKEDGKFPREIAREMMAPYTTNLKDAWTVDRQITFQTLVEAEKAYRQRNASGSASLSFLHEDEAEGDTAQELPDFEMRRRVNMNKLRGLGLTLSDMYFGLKITDFNHLVGLGLTSDHLTVRAGAMPLLPLLDLYDVRPSDLVDKIGFKADDLFRLEVDANTYLNAGLHFNFMVRRMGMNKDKFVQLRASPEVCRDCLFAEPSYMAKLKLGHEDYVQMGWSREDFKTTFELTDKMLDMFWPLPTVHATASASLPAVHATTSASRKPRVVRDHAQDFYEDSTYSAPAFVSLQRADAGASASAVSSESVRYIPGQGSRAASTTQPQVRQIDPRLVALLRPRQ